MRYVSYTLILLYVLSCSVSAFAKGDKYLEAVNNKLGFREAMSYAVHVDERDIEVGIERISKDDMKRLLGNDTSKFRPFDVAVTNNSRFRIYINQVIVRGQGGGQVYPHVDLSNIVEAIDPGGRGNKDDMRDAVLRTNVLSKALPFTVLAPGETVQGIVFVKDKSLGDGAELYIQVQNLKRVAFLDFVVPLEK